MNELIWIELEDAEPADEPTAVEFLRAGTFTDRHGRQVEISEDDLDQYVANFKTGAAGQDVPIDKEHAKGEAYGWIKRVWRDGQKLLAAIDWNDLGRRLVGERVYRYLSASVDTESKVIRSISLVNFPAVKGLAPVELSEGIYTLQPQLGLVARLKGELGRVIDSLFASGDPVEDAELSDAPQGAHVQEAQMNEQEKATLLEQARAEVRAELEADLAEKEARYAELKEQARAEVEAELTERFARERELAEFAQGICSGEHGLSAKPEDVVSALASLTKEQAEPIKALLKAKVVDFGEVGSGREGKPNKKALPVEFADALRKGEITLDALKELETVSGLGDLNQYDLTEFEHKE